MIKFDSIPETSNTSVVVLTGTVSPAIASLEYGTDLSALSSVPINNLRFTVVLELVAGLNDFFFVGRSGVNAFVESTRASINYTVPTVGSLQLQTQLDLHGEMLGVERFEGEKNPNYRTRLVQAAEASPDGHDVIQKLAATEVAFPYSRNALRVWVDRSSYNRPLLNDPFVRVTDNALEITAAELRTEELVNFNWSYPYIIPANDVAEVGHVQLYLESGEEVPQHHYEYDPESGRVWVKLESLSDQDLILSYQTVLSFSLSSDFAALVTAVQADGRLGIEFTDSENHTSTSDSNLLVPRGWEALDSREQYPDSTGRDQPGNRFSVSEITTFALHESKRDLLNAEGNGLGTKLQKYVEEINRIDRRTWDRVVVGKDGFRDQTVVPLFDSFVHVTDNVRGYWGASQYNINEYAYLGTSADEYKGVRHYQWQSGIGSQDDLEPSVVDLDQPNSDDVFDDGKIPPNVIYGVL